MLAPLMAAVFFIGLLIVPFIHSAATGTADIPLFDPGQYSKQELTTSTLNDGIPDAWKVYYGLSTIDPAVANSDYNGSGIMNREKYQLNIHPLASADPPEPVTPAKNVAKSAKSTAQAAPNSSPPSVANGNFTGGVNIGRSTTSGGFANASFKWSYNTKVDGWNALVGKQIEVWRDASGVQFVELNASGTSRGIEQKIASAKAGTYVLSWRDLCRNQNQAGDGAYKVHVFAKPPESDGSIGGVPVTTSPKPETYVYKPLKQSSYKQVKDWTQQFLVFTLTEEMLKNNPDVWIAFEPQSSATYGAFIAQVSLTPVELAPDLLPVNADFNRGDTSNISARRTGASPDFMGKTLIAARDSIDGRFKKEDRVTKDLHQGWFGLNRNKLPSDFFQGATVTVCKKVKTDTETNKPESGQIRLYATWGQKDEKCIEPYKIGGRSYDIGGASDPINLVPLIYSANSEVPADAQLWIEGVCIGKITLEWRLQKGSTDVKFEQTFNVRNDWTKEQWQAVVRDELFVDSFTSSSGAAINGLSAEGLDINDYLATGGFTTNRPYIYSVFEYYAKLHKQNLDDLFLWKGMAKMAGAPIYAGLSDAASAEALGLFPGTSKAIQGILFDGNIRVFNDLVYQYVAYRTSGIKAMKYLVEHEAITQKAYEAWQLIDQGYKNHSFTDVADGNQKLLLIEQKEILKQTYVDLSALSGGYIAKLFSVLAKTPVPGGQVFTDVVPGGNLANFDDRWKWIADPQQGMWKLWTADVNRSQRISFASQNLAYRASLFCWLPLE